MKLRLLPIVAWTCAILVSAFQLFAAVMKFMPIEPGSQAAAMNQSLGMTPDIAHALGILEIAIIILFLIPRTATIGFVLMVGYFGGVYATMITHGMGGDGTPMIVIVFALLMISAAVRSPELLTRAKTGKI
jgi:hypothetical protein